MLCRARKAARELEGEAGHWTGRGRMHSAHGSHGDPIKRRGGGWGVRRRKEEEGDPIWGENRPAAKSGSAGLRK